MGNIHLRIWSEYYIKQGKPGYDFGGYSVDFQSKKEKEWPEGCVSGHDVEEIADLVLCVGKAYRIMVFPSYKIELCEGPFPTARHKIEKTALLTRAPEEEFANSLCELFDEYYLIKHSVSESRYDEAYERICASRMGSTFLRTLTERRLKEFYIGLRKISKDNAIRMSETHFSHRFYEMETAYLHDLEGELSDKR